MFDETTFSNFSPFEILGIILITYMYHNRNGLSRYLTDEISMPSEDRKNFVLPCGFTLAQSWAALRKCWKGFYIARSRDDSDKMAEYASQKITTGNRHPGNGL
jgi:hypothetical protein